MTNPQHAQPTDKGRYYVHPQTGECWPSVTNVLDTCINKHVLVPWAAKITFEKAVRELPRMNYAARHPEVRDQLAKDIKGEVKVVRETAAGLGSRVHDWAESHVLGKPVPHDPEVEPFAKQVIEFFDNWGIDFETEVEATEMTVINREVGYAGTLDLLAVLDQEMWLIDYKTSNNPGKPVTATYTEQHLQLAALRHAEAALLADGTEVPLGHIDKAGVLNLRPNDHALMPLRSDGPVFDVFAHLVPAARMLHELADEKPQQLHPGQN